MIEHTSTGETQDQRTARHLATLREVTELARALAHKAAYDAAHMPPEPPPSAEAKPRPRPASDPRAVFDRLVRAIRDLITLERRIAGQPLLAAAPSHPSDDPGLGARDDLAMAGRLSRHDRRAREKLLRTGQV